MMWVTAVLLWVRCAASLKQQLETPARYDFVVVGGGTAGCALAARLSEVRGWRVLLLEAGGAPPQAADVPLAASIAVGPGSALDWGYRAERDARFCRAMEGGRCRWPRGRALGGSSAVNFMIHSRGSPHDYDHWARLGNSGWAYRDVLPYFRKSEDARLPADFGASAEFRGLAGPVPVRPAAWRSPLAPLFVAAAQQAGLPRNDPNGPQQVGVSFVQATVRGGRRWSAERAYLRPALGRPNLRVLTGATATRLIIDPATNSTRGVCFVRGGRAQEVLADKEVILSAGAINSPQLLMLSGVGPRDHLESLGIPVVQDLPAVGQNLQDHPAMGGITFTVNESVTIIDKRDALNPVNWLDYLLRGKGPLTLPGGAEALAFVRTPLAEGPGPDVELVMGAGAPSGDSLGFLRRLVGWRRGAWRSVWGAAAGRGADAWSLAAVLVRPRSRGSVRLRSRNPLHAPVLRANYYDDERDLQALVHGIKFAASLGESGPLRRFRSRLLRVPAPGCERETFGSDGYWACAVRQLAFNLHHQAGTCAMGGVVDSRLRLLGVRGARVVDASVTPTVPSGHTAAPVYMIAEKAADMIKQDWGQPIQ